MSLIKNKYWMMRALALARRSLGHTHPNPLVGAIVLDSQGNKVGEGYHQKAGQAHAEVIALRQAGVLAKGGTLYCTLEPCNHIGRVGPCTGAIIQSGISKVVVASQDMNELVAGQGFQKLRKSGVDINMGMFAPMEESLNLPFRTWIRSKKPLVTAKLAISQDGFVGLKSHRIKISSPIVQKTTMRLRAEAQAIVIGIRTANVDDPLLTIRDSRFPNLNPLKVVIDPDLKIKSGLRLFNDKANLLIVCKLESVNSVRAEELKVQGVSVFGLPSANETLQFEPLLEYFGSKNWTAILLEGGPKTIEHFNNQGLIDRWTLYQSSMNLRGLYPEDQLVAANLPQRLFSQVSRVVQRGPDREFWAHN